MKLTERERQIYNQLVRVFASSIQSVSRQIVNDRDFDIAELSDDLKRLLVVELQQVYISGVDTMLLDESLPAVDLDDIGTAAGDWARRHTFDLVRNITDNTRKQLQNALQTYLDTPGMTLEEVEALIAPAFSQARAERIAVTEITRANAASANGLQEHYREKHGLTYRRIWQTHEDDRVCPICRPLDGKDEREWSDRFPGGPPAHPNCRCSVSLRLVRRG